MMHKMTVQNTVNLASSSAHYLFYLSVLHFSLPARTPPGGWKPIRIYRLAASLFRLQGSDHVKKVVAFSVEKSLQLEL